MKSYPKLIRITTTAEMHTNQLSGQVDFMRQNGFDVLLISSAEETEPRLLQLQPCRHIVVPMTRRITPFADLAALGKLIRIINKEKPDIVHTESPKAGLLGMLAAKLCGIKIRIHTVAGLPLMVEKGMKRKVLDEVEKLTYAAATNVWPNGPSLRDYILEMKYTRKSKLHIIGKGSSNGIDLQKFNPSALNFEIMDEVKKSIQYDPSLTYLLFVGRMVYDKGVVELINVFKRLQKDHPNLRLLLIGYHERSLDPLPAESEYEIDNNKAIFHINWSDKIEYYMQLSNFFVFGTHREGFPNVLVEAGAMKLPIICSRIVGNIDMVEDNVTGILFESNNEDSFYKAIQKALSNPEQSKKMATRLYANITSSFDRKIYWQTMLAEYKRLVDKVK